MANTCSTANCHRPTLARGLCGTHYAAARRAGLPLIFRKGGPCEVPACGRRAAAQGFCATHYTRWRRHGTPERLTPQERFATRYVIDPISSCWLWIAAGSRRLRGPSYGQMYFDGRVQPAHRIAYQLAYGPIPEGLHIDHLCRNTLCVNPAHLEAVAPLENLRRGASRAGILFQPRAACSRDHNADQLRTYTRTRCLACLRESRSEKGLIAPATTPPLADNEPNWSPPRRAAAPYAG
jgi:HNH endonuclease